ncbi:MAG: hypothetical protein CVV27_00955 [Candidatus Melainabacteria bacterium HGW-Melainabacteria-1]|nr:MAG: hypothetical protein CVV27_00955 [Candidatus Melainabacteria bacterium HGW-Melainabacteria-1]
MRVSGSTSPISGHTHCRCYSRYSATPALRSISMALKNSAGKTPISSAANRTCQNLDPQEAIMASKPITMLVVGLACLGGAAALRYQTQGPRELEPRDQKTEQMIEAAMQPSPTPQPAISVFPPRRQASLSPNANPNASPSANPSASPGGSPSPGTSPSPLGAGASASPSASGTPSGSPAASASAGSVADLHQRAIVVDTHVETPFWISEKGVKLRNFNGQSSLDKLKAGGVDVVFFSIYVNPARYGKTAKRQAEFIISALKREIASNQDLIELATSHAEIQAILAKGKMAGLMGMEGGEAIESSVTNVDHFYKLGVRYLGPTWSVHNQLGDSSGPKVPRWKGLSPLGKQVIQRMNQLGMLIDVSHLSDPSFQDVLKLSTQPVIASHSGVDGVHVSPRNLSNDMLKLISVNGGAVGILFYPPFLEASGKADVASVAKHIHHAARVAGIDHVGLGSDFDGLDTPPPTGLKDASQFPAITAELKQRGYSESDIFKVLGGNFMRVFKQVLK